MTDFPTGPGSGPPPPPPSPPPPGPGWWQASDGNWYPPDQAPGFSAPPPPPPGYTPPPYGSYPVAPSTSTNNGFAIASLITSLVVCGIGSFLAVIFGHIALNQIKRNGEGGRGLAIAGLVLGYLGILAMIIAVIVLFPLSDSDSEFHFDSLVRSWT